MYLKPYVVMEYSTKIVLNNGSLIDEYVHVANEIFNFFCLNPIIKLIKNICLNMEKLELFSNIMPILKYYTVYRTQTLDRLSVKTIMIADLVWHDHSLMWPVEEDEEYGYENLCIVCGISFTEFSFVTYKGIQGNFCDRHEIDKTKDFKYG